MTKQKSRLVIIMIIIRGPNRDPWTRPFLHPPVGLRPPACTTR